MHTFFGTGCSLSSETVYSEMETSGNNFLRTAAVHTHWKFINLGTMIFRAVGLSHSYSCASMINLEQILESKWKNLEGISFL